MFPEQRWHIRNAQVLTPGLSTYRRYEAKKDFVFVWVENEPTKLSHAFYLNFVQWFDSLLVKQLSNAFSDATQNELISTIQQTERAHSKMHEFTLDHMNFTLIRCDSRFFHFPHTLAHTTCMQWIWWENLEKKKHSKSKFRTNVVVYFCIHWPS